ncbi:glycoside hydrolase family 15 protein [Streptomyces sp. SD31]|uniref:glycoside hydrolase family 15 protein n=1 Tax=Streptomyces sp. SD31 TaxID=3452208 RepID=UPI003F8C8CF6
MRRYPPIADHGMVGDLQTAALVSSDGTVDWLCAPRFDSPSVFASLLDHNRGGHFAVWADTPRPPIQLYLQDTAVLVTRFLAEDGVGEVVDFMPVEHPERPAGRHRLVRIPRVTRGRVRFTLQCRPRFDYGRAGHRIDLAEDAVRFDTPGARATLQTAGPVTWTRDFWHAWIRRSRYRGRWQDMVNRAAITLKLLTYAPTGAPVAAPTVGLPEQIGGGRNWDYRYTWVRDGSMSVGALLGLGYFEEAHAFRSWLGDRLRANRTVNGEPLQIMYRIDGDPDLPEEVLDHLEGYRGSAPVRVGNDAAGQLQLDIYGEAVLALSQAVDDAAEVPPYDGRQSLAGVLDWLVKAWNRPDEGIRETRGGQKDFTYSRLMCWAAFDRGIRMAKLVSDSLVYRYDPEASPDGLRGSEGTFSLCSFLYVDALARAGRLGPARYAFDKMLTYANHGGLFAEEVGPTGEQLGNFPQAFTHLALVTAALSLDQQMDAAG